MKIGDIVNISSKEYIKGWKGKVTGISSSDIVTIDGYKGEYACRLKNGFVKSGDEYYKK